MEKNRPGFFRWVCVALGLLWVVTLPAAAINHYGKAYDATGVLSQAYQETVGQDTLAGQATAVSDPLQGDNTESQKSLDYVYDQVGLLTEEEAAQLNTQAATFFDQYQCGVYIIVVEDRQNLEGVTVSDTGVWVRDNWGLGYGEGQDALLLFLSQADQSFVLVTHGAWAQQAFSNSDLQSMQKAVLDEFEVGQFYEGFQAYLDYGAVCLQQAQTGRTVGFWATDKAKITVGISLVIGALVGLLICGILHLNMKSAVKQQDADQYLTKGRITITVRRDDYTHSTEERVKIKK